MTELESAAVAVAKSKTVPQEKYVRGYLFAGGFAYETLGPKDKPESKRENRTPVPEAETTYGPFIIVPVYRSYGRFETIVRKIGYILKHRDSGAEWWTTLHKDVTTARAHGRLVAEAFNWLAWYAAEVAA